MKLILTLAWRNLWRNKRRTMITVSSVMFAVLLAGALLSFAAGFQKQMLETMVRQETGYLQIQDVMYLDEPIMDHMFEYGDELKKAIEPFDKEIEYTIPRIQGFSLAAKEITSKPAIVTGIVPEKEDKLRNLSKNIVEGQMFSDDDDYAVIGKGLADMLDVVVGDTLVLIGQGFQAMSAAGKYEVGGIIEFALPEQNNTIVFLPLQIAQWYFAADNRLTNLLLMIDDEEKAGYLAEAIQAKLDDEWYAARTWQELMPDIVGLIQMQNTVYSLIAWIFYIIVGFGIFGTILNMLYERMREFGILLSLGMKRLQLGVVCLIETFCMGILGVLIGVMVGFPIILLFQIYPIRFTGETANYMLDFGMEPVFPFLLDINIFWNQALAFFVITMIIGLYSMNKIFKINLMEAARN